MGDEMVDGEVRVGVVCPIPRNAPQHEHTLTLQLWVEVRGVFGAKEAVHLLWSQNADNSKSEVDVPWGGGGVEIGQTGAFVAMIRLVGAITTCLTAVNLLQSTTW